MIRVRLGENESTDGTASKFYAVARTDNLAALPVSIPVNPYLLNFDVFQVFELDDQGRIVHDWHDLLDD